jgi:uncharacterized protein with HEPN domain
MTRHDDIVRLRHMLDHAREAVAMLTGKKRADLQSERMLELALVRLIEIVGEAAARVNPEGQALYPLIPWREVVAGCATDSFMATTALILTFCGIR